MTRILTSEKGLNLIKNFEGFSPIIYKCLAGFETIGYGHKISPKESFNTITLEEGHRLLCKDVSFIENSIKRNIFVPLTNGQLDALASFTYNVGAGALQRSTLRQKINRSQFESIEEEFMRWIYVGPNKVKGLILRRRAELELFFS
jgi:lysozyme